MARHSSRSPSTAHRYMRCPGAPNAEAGLPDTAGLDAAEGTAFHELMADCLQFGMEPEDFRGHVIHAGGFEFTVDEDMIRFGQPGLARVRELAVGCELYVETWVDLEPWLGPGEGGTSDVGIVNVRDREITVFDWKYGQGVPVSPVDNEQLQLYGLGFWHKIAQFAFRGEDPKTVNVRIHIEQPRAPGGGGEWMTDLAHLLEFGKRATAAVKLSRDPAAPRMAGETQCKFCKAKPTCGEFARFNLAMMNLKFDDLDDAISMDYAPPIPPVADLTPERRAFVVRHSDMFTTWLAELHATVLTDALAGRPTPGLKAVIGRQGARAWLDEEAAAVEAQKLVADPWKPRELQSPTQLSKVVSKSAYETVLKQFVTQAPGKPCLVPDTDSREAVQSHVSKFDNLEG